MDATEACRLPSGVLRRVKAVGRATVSAEAVTGEQSRP